jgi:GNAT superfamily N-acetyltransferase
MIDPDTRAAHPDDLPQIVLLEGEARAALVDQRGGRRWLAENPEIGDGWADVLGSHHVVVGHIGPVVVSVIAAALGDDDVLRVGFVWVTPDARELGFGDAMLAAVIQWGRAEGAIGVEGQALPGDRQTKNLWERAGIVARLIVTYRQF